MEQLPHMCTAAAIQYVKGWLCTLKQLESSLIPWLLLQCLPWPLACIRTLARYVCSPACACGQVRSSIEDLVELVKKYPRENPEQLVDEAEVSLFRWTGRDFGESGGIRGQGGISGQRRISGRVEASVDTGLKLVYQLVVTHQLWAVSPVVHADQLVRQPTIASGQPWRC